MIQCRYDKVPFIGTLTIGILVLIACTDARFILYHLLEQHVMQRMDWESVGNETIRLFDECIGKSKDISFPGKVCSKLTEDLTVKKYPHIIQNFAKCMEQQTGSSTCLNFPEEFKSMIETWQTMLMDQYEQRGRGKAIKCMVEAQQNATHYCQMSDKMTVQAVHHCSNTTGMDEMHQVFMKCIDIEMENKKNFIESQKSVFSDHFVDEEMRKESKKKGSIFYVEKGSNKNESIVNTMFGEGREQSRRKSNHNMKNVGMFSMFGLNSIEENVEFSNEKEMEFGLASLFGMTGVDVQRKSQEEQFSLASMFGDFQEEPNDFNDNKMFSESMFGMPKIDEGVGEGSSEFETENNDAYEILFASREEDEGKSWENDDDVDFFGRMWESEEAISTKEWEKDDDEDDLYGLLWDSDEVSGTGEWENAEDAEDGDLFVRMWENGELSDTEDSESIYDEDDEDDVFRLMWGSGATSDIRDRQTNADEDDLYELMWGSGGINEESVLENNNNVEKYKRNEANLLAESMFDFGGLDETVEADLLKTGEHEDMSKKMMELIGASDVMMKQLIIQLPSELA